MKTFVFSILLFALVCRAFANDEQPKSVVSPADKLAAIQREYREAEAAYDKAVKSLPDTPEGEANSVKLSKQFDKQQQDLFMAAVELAKANPKSQVGCSALEWALKEPRGYHVSSGPPALELMSRQYADNPGIGNIIALLAYYLPWTNSPSYNPAVDLLNAVVEKNPDRAVRGQALLGLAWKAKRESPWYDSESNPDANRFAAIAAEKFETVIRDYGDCTNLRTMGVRPPTRTLGEEAKPELYEIRHLRIGEVAPEIDGEDLDGTPLKLSNFRGKVVLLVFWASWCGPCMAAVPHEKALLEQFKGRPFVVVGVSGDGSKKDAVKAVNKSQIPWRTFWDGEKGPGGPIAVGWNVRGWPTFYVLDHKGVIRLKYVPGRKAATLEKFVSAAEKH